MRHILATSRPWHESMARQLSDRCGEEFYLITRKNDLTVDTLKRLQPRYLFFPHWSYMIPAEVFERFECIVFHMTDLPFGRGGSPLQNLISRGIHETKVTALRCVKEVDAGPVYMKRPLSLHGNAEEIYIRAGQVVEDMICEIIEKKPEPVEQSGEVTLFERRRPEQSNIAAISGLNSLFDHIRMLDAEGYPLAYLEADGFRFEFTRAALRQDCIEANVIISKVNDE